MRKQEILASAAIAGGVTGLIYGVSEGALQIFTDYIPLLQKIFHVSLEASRNGEPYYSVLTEVLTNFDNYSVSDKGVSALALIGGELAVVGGLGYLFRTRIKRIVGHISRSKSNQK